MGVTYWHQLSPSKPKTHDWLVHDSRRTGTAGGKPCGIVEVVVYSLQFSGVRFFFFEKWWVDAVGLPPCGGDTLLEAIGASLGGGGGGGGGMARIAQLARVCQCPFVFPFGNCPKCEGTRHVRAVPCGANYCGVVRLST
jgi:hypothetical protein